MKPFSRWLALAWVLFFPGPAFAQEGASEGLSGLLDTIRELFSLEQGSILRMVIEVIYNSALAVAVLFIIVAAYRYFFNNAEEAKRQIQNVFIGLFILAISKTVIDLTAGISQDIAGATGTGNLGEAITFVLQDTVIPLLAKWGGIISVLSITIGGFYYMTSNAEEGITWIRNGIIGVILIILSWIIVETAASILGLS